MDFRFQVKATAFDFFKMSMKKTYKSPLGVCNIIFFIASLLLTLKFFSGASPLARALMLFMCLLIPVIQPLGIYLRSKSYAMAIPPSLILEARNTGIYVEAGEKSDHITWNKVFNIFDTGDCVVLKLIGGNGYFLFNRILGDRREAFIDYVKEQILLHANKSK